MKEQPRKKKRGLRRFMITTAVAIGVLLLGAGLYVGFSNQEPARIAKALILRPFTQAENAKKLLITSSNGIDEEQFVSIGGIDQWMTIRGEDRNNPVLLFLHGGPGAGHTMFNPVTRPWEKDFTIVQYDQRGAGKTFRKNGATLKPGELSFAQLEKDGIEAAEYVKKHLGKEKVVLVASSVGTTFGVAMAEHRPDLFYAYVGTDQNVGGDAFQTSRELTLQWLREIDDKEGIKTVEAMSTDKSKWTQKEYQDLNQLTIKANKHVPDMVMDVIFPALMSSPAHTMEDIQDVQTGMEQSMNQLYPELIAYDARKTTTFQIPFFIFQGDGDGITPTSSAKAYFDAVQAPHKEFALIRNSGHLAAFAQPDQFLEELLNRVRPLLP